VKNFFKTGALLYLITEGYATAENFSGKSNEILETIRRAVKAKVDFIQIREKKLPARMIFDLAVRAVKISQNSETKILINDRADIAFAANADGVHLTANSLPAEIIKNNFPENFLVGVSAHTLAEIETARMQKANFATFSPIFKTPSKEKYGAPQGLKKLREVCEKVKPFPVIALGGIDETNFSAVLKNGASGLAAIRFLNTILAARHAD
jgi:thiamine-phosphate pyrophosphorylase